MTVAAWTAYILALIILMAGPDSHHIAQLEQRIQLLESTANSRRDCGRAIAVMAADGKSAVVVCQ